MKNSPIDTPIRIGIVGTGFISRGFTFLLQQQTEYIASRVLTRRNVDSCNEFPRQDLLTQSLTELIEHSDIIVECSGDPIHAADVTDLAFSASLPVVTMNTEFHVTCGSYFVSKGLLTEAEGDQPGCLAALAEEAVSMGFKPLVYGNVKGFYNNNPTLKDMQFWSKKQGISLAMVTSATDGTKLQAEQVLVANGLNATIAQQGLLGFQSDNLEEDGLRLADIAKNKGRAISDYLISAKEETRVFIVAEHSEYQQASLEYLKLGKGPYYTLTKNRVLCHLEILKTVKRVISQKTPLLNNSGSPTISLCAIAKMDLPSGTHIAHAIGSFEIRGIAIKITDYPQHIPIGLLSDAVITKAVEKGEVICFNHIEIKPSLALKAWQESILIS
jgi:predicted homoserine dehydrogenase-like protein